MSEPPWLYLDPGPNGAGKTTLVHELQRPAGLLDGVPVINPDVIAQRLDPDKPERAAIAAGRLTIREFSRLLRLGRTFARETTLSGRSNLRQIRQARSAGFRFHLVFIGLSAPEMGIDRIETRKLAGGHYVPPGDVVRRYWRSMQNLPLVVPLVERTSIYDNSGRRHVRLAEIEAGLVRAAGTDQPPWLTRALGRELTLGESP